MEHAGRPGGNPCAHYPVSVHSGGEGNERCYATRTTGTARYSTHAEFQPDDGDYIHKGGNGKVEAGGRGHRHEDRLMYDVGSMLQVEALQARSADAAA